MCIKKYNIKIFDINKKLFLIIAYILSLIYVRIKICDVYG